MASTPDIENAQFGYYVTPVFEEVIAYVHEILRKFNCSCIFVLHTSAIFECDGEREELHMAAYQPVVLDPANPFIDDIMENQHGLCFDNDQYEDKRASDCNLVPGTHRFWFKILRCQPNPDPNQTSQNTSEQDGDDNNDDEDEDRPRSPVYRMYSNTFLLSIGEYFLRKNDIPVPRVLLLKHKAIEEWVLQNMPALFTSDDLHEPMTLQDVPEWHFERQILNIRIFSMFGNVLYAKKFNDSENWIDLYLNSKRTFALVLKLNALFKRGLDRVLCKDCHTFHRTEGNCKLKVVQSDNEQVVMRKVPHGRHALVAYSDFESIIKDDNYHETSGWACCVIDRHHHMTKMEWENAKTHTGSLIESYLEFLFMTAKEFTTSGDNRETEKCQICDKIITDNEYIIGRNFMNGRPGNHHVKCWHELPNCLFVFFHNFRGYDSHFLIKDIVKTCQVLGMQATSMEKFNMIRITSENHPLIKICFKDTFNFFTCSLAKCISMVENWIYTPENSRYAKGTFPYDWFDSFDKLDATELPPAPWINKLSNSVIDHEPAFKEWRQHGFTNFAQYHDFYMTNDTMQLADAFEEFRRTCVDEFDTDPVHFQGAPAYTWYLGLRNNPKLFKVITDKKIYLDIQSQIRGGVSQAMVRYCNVEDKPEESMFFLDVNSLYSKCMTYKMPGRYIERLEELPNNWQELYCEEGKFCALINVDLIYPEHLHDRDWAYPLAPHKFNERLCTTLLRKENYLVHSELLQFYLDRGMLIEKVNYLYVFEQDYTLRDYVQNNIEKRRHTKSEVMKTLYKLLNNSLYGKTCENVFKYRKFEVHEDNTTQGGQVNPFLYSAKNVIMYDDKYLCEMQVDTVKLNKPIQIGFTILEFAKREIYRFLAQIQDHFGQRVIPLYTDTDSLLFWCDFKEPWKEFYNSPLMPYLDFEKVPDSWGVKTNDTDKQSGLWSPEADGKEIIEYVGLRSKTYCYRFRDNKLVIKNKGIPKSAMVTKEDDTPREKITIEHYRQALFHGTEYKISQYAIRSEKHQVQTKYLYKLGLSANDLKRSVLPDRTHSLPYGYKGELFKDKVADADDPDKFTT